MEKVSNDRARHLPIVQGEMGERVSAPPVPALSYRRLWLITALSGGLILAAIFGGYELLERFVLHDAAPSVIYALHLARGVGSAIVLGTWAFLVAVRTRRHYARQLTHNIQRLETAVDERTAQLERSRAFTEHLFDTLRDRIVVTNAEGQVVKVNRMARESVPDRCDEPCHTHQECGQVCRFVPDPEQNHELRRDPVSGRLFDVQRYPVPARPGDDALVLEVARDVTEAKRLEALVVHQEKMASLGVLAAGIAHDIGNPLASLSSELEMVQLEDDPEQFRSSLGVLREHVDRIGRALREMVDFARRRGDDGAGSVSASHAIADALRLIRHDQRTRNVEISVDVEPDLPPLKVVEDHVVLVLVNLALNALDAMPEGGVLRVGARAVNEGVEIEVGDDGVGMPADVIERAFEPLFSTKLESGGTGLGLTVSQSVVRAAGGAMQIDSQPGRGTDVKIRLPSGASA